MTISLNAFRSIASQNPDKYVYAQGETLKTSRSDTRHGAHTYKTATDAFASAITDLLFDEFDALTEGLDEKEEGTLKSDVYFVATGELGLGYWDALKEANILNTLMKDVQKMGGDKDYKVDIGV